MALLPDVGAISGSVVMGVTNVGTIGANIRPLREDRGRGGHTKSGGPPIDNILGSHAEAVR